MPSNDSESQSNSQSSPEWSADDTRRIDRRTVLTASAGLSAALAGCVGSGPSEGGDGEDTVAGDATTGESGTVVTQTEGEYPDYSGQTLSVATWAGIYSEAFEESVAKLFEERTGATVEVNPAGASILSEIRSAPADDPPYDVASAEGFFYWQGQQDDLFLEVREENIPNLDSVYPYLKELRGTEYGVPTDGSLEGILYRTDIGWEPQEWLDLLSDKEGTDRIGFEGGWYIYPFMTAAVSLEEREGIEELYHENDHQALFDRMREFAQNVELWTGSFAEIRNSLLQGIIDMSMWYSGMGNAAAVEDEVLEFVTPDRTAGYLDHYCPIRGTDNREMVEVFLNHMLDPEVQSAWADEGYVYVSNPDVDYPDRVADQYPTSNDEWANVSIADFTRLQDYAGKLSDEFQAIKNE